MARTCASLRADGGRCGGIPATGSDYCPAHSPERAEDRRRAASKAARARHAPDSLEALRGRLTALYEGLADGTVNARTGQAMTGAARVLLATIQAENEMKNAEALEKRLAKIEDLERQLRRAG